MNRFERNDLVNMLKSQRPENVRDFTWDLLVSDACRIAEHEGDSVFDELVKSCYESLEKFSPSIEVRDHLLEEIRRFKRQLNEHAPDTDTAKKETEAYTVVKDYDGYDVAEEHYKTTYKLLKPWRNFRAGQTITWWEGRQCVGGYVSGHWQLT